MTNDNSHCMQRCDHSHDMCKCQQDDCCKIGYQYADISIPVEIKPKAIVGKIETECCGEPTVVCSENICENSCEVIVTQRVSIKIPICYKVLTCVGESKINCDCKKSCN